MNNFTKIITGWVSQDFKLNKDGVFVCDVQDFRSGDLCEYEDSEGCPIDKPEYQYQPYDMVQPEESVKKAYYACESCSQIKVDVMWREETEQYECGECYEIWRKEQGL